MFLCSGLGSRATVGHLARGKHKCSVIHLTKHGDNVPPKQWYRYRNDPFREDYYMNATYLPPTNKATSLASMLQVHLDQAERVTDPLTHLENISMGDLRVIDRRNGRAYLRDGSTITARKKSRTSEWVVETRGPIQKKGHFLQ